MSHRRMLRPALVSAALLALAIALAPAVPAAPASRVVTVEPRAVGAMVRQNPVPGRPSAGYLTIVGGSTADRLVSASAPGARIELHSMSMEGGIMRMAKLDGLVVPAAARVALAPGGTHLMIFDLAAGAQSLPITLEFASGASIAVTATVRAAGTMPGTVSSMMHPNPGHGG
jgi:copper(I)-binding protein